MSLESLAGLLRALSDPCRLRLLVLCAERPAAVSALAAALEETEPTVSRHLKALAAVGVLRRVRRGQRVEYSRAAARRSMTSSRPPSVPLPRRTSC
jgi:ArsR family transcriptional regulator, lead/cadmium/zinc/bismuth-responsive transcriptional repressor